MCATRSVLQDLFSAQQPRPCNVNTKLSVTDMVADDPDRCDYDHDCYYDSIATACSESDGDSSSVATNDEEPCQEQEEALARPPRCTEHDSSTLPEKNITAASLTSCSEQQIG